MRTTKTVVACLVAMLALSVGATTASASLKSTNKRVTKLQAKVKRLGATVGGIQTSLISIKKDLASVKAVTDQAGALVDNLVKLGKLATTVRYGAVAVYANNNPDPTLGLRITSGQIPLDGNQALVGGTLLTGIPSGSSATVLHFRASIRSNETSGTSDTSDPAGQAGGSLVAICAGKQNGNQSENGINYGGSTCPAIVGGSASCTGPPAGVCVANFPAGTPMGFCQTSSKTFSLPDGTTTSQSLVNIQRKVSRTDQTAPTNTLTEAGGNSYALCDLSLPPGYGAGYNITLYAQSVFVHIPTSTSPEPDA